AVLRLVRHDVGHRVLSSKHFPEKWAPVFRRKCDQPKSLCDLAEQPLRDFARHAGAVLVRLEQPHHGLVPALRLLPPPFPAAPAAGLSRRGRRGWPPRPAPRRHPAPCAGPPCAPPRPCAPPAAPAPYRRGAAA